MKFTRKIYSNLQYPPRSAEEIANEATRLRDALRVVLGDTKHQKD